MDQPPLSSIPYASPTIVHTPLFDRATNPALISGNVLRSMGQRSVRPKFSSTQALPSMVGMGIATYRPSCEGIAHTGGIVIVRHSRCAFPAQST